MDFWNTFFTIALFKVWSNDSRFSKSIMCYKCVMTAWLVLRLIQLKKQFEIISESSNLQCQFSMGQILPCCERRKEGSVCYRTLWNSKCLFRSPNFKALSVCWSRIRSFACRCCVPKHCISWVHQGDLSSEILSVATSDSS